jgi:hypothetical protein
MNGFNARQPDVAKRGRYNPITADQIARPRDDGAFDLTKTLSKGSRMLAVPFFGLLFVVENLKLAIAPISILLLFGCLYYRMDLRMRQIASIPLAFSTFLLFLQFSVGRGIGGVPSMNGLDQSDPSGWGMPFVPLFLSACLFFMPLRDTKTFKMVAADSFLLLASGLIPGLGFLVIFYLVHYTLFIAIVIAIISDLKNYDVKALFSDSQAATQ